MLERLYLACLFGFVLGFFGAVLFSVSKSELMTKMQCYSISRLVRFSLRPIFSLLGILLFFIKLSLLVFFWSVPDLFLDP